MGALARLENVRHSQENRVVAQQLQGQQVRPRGKRLGALSDSRGMSVRQPPLRDIVPLQLWVQDPWR